MRQSIEGRSADEMEAVEALLTLARIQYEHLPQHQPLKTASATIVTSTPYPKPPKKRVYIAPTGDEQTDFVSVIYIRRDSRESNSLSPVSSGSDERAATTTRPKTEASDCSTPRIPVKSNSGRIIKRTRRFISQSDEETDPQNGARKLTTTAAKRSKKQKVNINTINTTNDSEECQEEDIIPPAKKFKIEPVCVVDEPKVGDDNKSDSSSSSSSHGSNGISKNAELPSKFKRGLFNSNITSSMQLDKVRHSRLFEAAYELQHCQTADASVEFQHRAAENLITYKSSINAKRNQIASNRSSQVMALMRKFRDLKNRHQICTEFASKFGATKSAKWKPFTEDEDRSNDLSNYRKVQMTNQPFIKFWTDQFVTQSNDKEKARSILIDVIKMLPNRPEIRHEYINGSLPKLVAAHKQAVKKNKGLAIKSETIDTSAALAITF